MEQSLIFVVVYTLFAALFCQQPNEWTLIDTSDANALVADAKYPILAHDISSSSLYIYYSCDSCYLSNSQYTNYLSRLDLNTLTLQSNYDAPNIIYYDRPWSFYCQMDANTVYFRTLESNYIGKLNIQTFEINNTFLDVPTSLLNEHWLTITCDSQFSDHLYLLTFYNAAFWIYDFTQHTWTQGTTPIALGNNFQPVILNENYLYYTQSTAGNQVQINYIDTISNSVITATGNNQIIRVYECTFMDYNNLNQIHFIGGRYNANPYYDAEIYQIYDIQNDTFITPVNQLNYNRDHVGCIAVDGIYFVFGGSTYISGNSAVTDLNKWEYYDASTNNIYTDTPTSTPTSITSQPSSAPICNCPTEYIPVCCSESLYHSPANADCAACDGYTNCKPGECIQPCTVDNDLFRNDCVDDGCDTVRLSINFSFDICLINVWNSNRNGFWTQIKQCFDELINDDENGNRNKNNKYDWRIIRYVLHDISHEYGVKGDCDSGYQFEFGIDLCDTCENLKGLYCLIESLENNGVSNIDACNEAAAIAMDSTHVGFGGIGNAQLSVVIVDDNEQCEFDVNEQCEIDVNVGNGAFKIQMFVAIMIVKVVWLISC